MTCILWVFGVGPSKSSKGSNPISSKCGFGAYVGVMDGLTSSKSECTVPFVQPLSL